MKYAIVAVPSALLGALLGAVLALLFAPSSGKELRSNIKTGVDTQVAKGKETWNGAMQEADNRIKQINKNVKERIGQPDDSAKQGEPVA
jgi:gas vesicle protein